jgi:hypothetical protein
MNTFQTIPDGSDLFEEPSAQTLESHSETDAIERLIDTLQKADGARDAKQKKKH